MAAQYGFNQEQKDYLTELLQDKNNSLWSSVLYGITASDDQIVTVALSQIGNVGGEPYWSWYGFGSRVEWCACFVSWCANECGYIETGVIPKFAGCVNGVQWFKDRGQWMDGSAEPVPGMIILGDYQLIFDKTEEMVERLIKKGYLYFGAGGALGFDTIAALAVLKLKEHYPDIRLILVLPCRFQTRGWASEDVKIYENIKEQADKVVYTSEEYTRGCMHKRNRHLVDNSSACIAYLTESKGGTAYTVDYAAKHGLTVFNIADCL